VLSQVSAVYAVVMVGALVALKAIERCEFWTIEAVYAYGFALQFIFCKSQIIHL